MRASWAVTIGAVLTWAALSAVSRVLLLRLGLDPWSFSFIQLCAGGVVLLAMSGKGPFGVTSFKRPATWVLGVLRVFSAALYTAILAWVSVLEAGILGSMNVPMIAIAVWTISGRRPARAEWLGHVVMLGAIAALIADLDGGFRHPAVGLMLLNALCLVAIAILAERHPDNISDQPGVRLGFTGAVLLVTAGLFLLVRLAQSSAGAGAWGAGAWDWTLLISAAAVGVLLRAPSMILAFWSIRLIGAQNYMAAIAFLPLMGMAFEEIFFTAGLIDVSRFRMETLFLGLGVVAGTLIVLAARMWPTWSTTASANRLFRILHLPTVKPDHANRPATYEASARVDGD